MGETTHLCGMPGDEAFLAACRDGCADEVVMDIIMMEPVERRHREQFVTRVEKKGADDEYVSTCYDRRTLSEWLERSHTLPHNRAPLTQLQVHCVLVRNTLNAVLDAYSGLGQDRSLAAIQRAEDCVARLGSLLDGSEPDDLARDVIESYWRLRREQLARVFDAGGGDRFAEYASSKRRADAGLAMDHSWWIREVHDLDPVTFVHGVYNPPYFVNWAMREQRRREHKRREIRRKLREHNIREREREALARKRDERGLTREQIRRKRALNFDRAMRRFNRDEVRRAAEDGPGSDDAE